MDAVVLDTLVRQAGIVLVGVSEAGIITHIEGETPENIAAAEAIKAAYIASLPSPAEVEAAAIAKNISELWKAAYEYEFDRISAGAWGLVTIGVISSVPTAQAIAAWSAAHWNLYYARKALTTASRNSTHLDFTSSGELPFSIPQLRTALGM